MSFLCGSVAKNPTANPGDAGDGGLITGQEAPLEKEMAPTPVLLPGESHGQRGLAGYSPWGHEKSGTTERLNTYVCCKDKQDQDFLVAQ